MTHFQDMIEGVTEAIAADSEVDRRCAEMVATLRALYRDAPHLRGIAGAREVRTRIAACLKEPAAFSGRPYEVG